MEQLAELDVPVGVAYGSGKTGGLCVFGDQRIIWVISKHSTEIIESKEWFSTTTGSTVPDTLSLPKLPKPWSRINAPTVKAILVGVVKDLGLPWMKTANLSGGLRMFRFDILEKHLQI